MTDAAPAAGVSRLQRRRPIVVAAVVGGLALLILAFGFAWRSESRPPPLVMDLPPGWQTVDAGGRFSFRAPPDLRPEPVRGIDSLVGRYRGPSLSLNFDHGWYSDPLRYAGKPEYQRRRVSVSGFDADVVEYRDPASTQPHVTAIHFHDLGDGRTRLTLWTSGQTPGDRRDALRIFASLAIAPAAR